MIDPFPWVPSKTNWPPDYVACFAWRQKALQAYQRDPNTLRGALEYYRTHPVEFIQHWCSTYDPRLAGREHEGKITTMPFLLWPRQVEAVEFIYYCLGAERHGLFEKARDMGLTWLSVAVSVHLWCFLPGASVGWGSRLEDLVDKIGNPDSIFEKMRIIIRRLPRVFWPDGFDPKTHMPFMKITNPASGATITGETGDNIGRGGRSLIYFIDEAAHLARPELIEASLGDNTRVQIHISSVNGLGNPFHRRRKAGIDWDGATPIPAGKTGVFVMDWRDHPEKTQEWYEADRKDWEERGLLHKFSQEKDRNYAASVTGLVIRPEWVNAALNAHVDLTHLGDWESGPTIAALDVADDTPDGDLNALAVRKGSVLRHIEDWGGIDTGKTTRKAISILRPFGAVALQYDAIGLGASVKAESNRLQEDAETAAAVRQISFHPWVASAKVLYPLKRLIKRTDGTDDPNSPKNEDHFANLKAQAWSELAQRFYRTFKARTLGEKYEPSLLISIPSDLLNRQKLMDELSQATYTTDGRSSKVVINKSPNGTRSPNDADAAVMAFWPVGTGASKYTAESVGA